MKSEEIRFAINFEYNEHNLSVKEFDLMLQDFAMTYHKEQLNMHDVSMRSEQFYCDNKERKYKDSVCTNQCDMCEYTANHK